MGRTPRSARVPLDPLFANEIGFMLCRRRPTGASAADQGVRPTPAASGVEAAYAAGFGDTRHAQHIRREAHVHLLVGVDPEHVGE